MLVDPVSSIQVVLLKVAGHPLCLVQFTLTGVLPLFLLNRVLFIGGGLHVARYHCMAHLLPQSVKMKVVSNVLEREREREKGGREKGRERGGGGERERETE